MFTDVWYPVDAAEARGRHPSGYLASTIAVADAPVSSHRPFPLVVYSHGSRSIGADAEYLTETLASYGFVVAAPSHAGDTVADQARGTTLPPERLAVDRPRDVSFTITDMLRRSSGPAGLLAGAIDPARIAVDGHSFGGYTALAVAGGVPGVPADPRVKAVVAMAPGRSATIGGVRRPVPLAAAMLAADHLPTMLFAGTSDTVVPLTPNLLRAYRLITGTPLFRVDLVGGAHASFTDLCGYIAALHAPPDPSCAPPAISVADAHRLVDIYTIAFLVRELNGDRRWDRYLDPRTTGQAQVRLSANT